LNSFLGKLKRKSYSAPFDDITDLAGVRVVYLYSSDAAKIESVIRKEFVVLDKVDKLNEKEADQFGYLATHFISRLGKGSSGARYDDLKDLVCEIQVRTVLQDAWAIIQHHLIYKQESAVPKSIQRKLNSLAGLFETADDQFDRIRSERAEYVAEVRDSLSTPAEFLKNDVNIDSLREYLSWKFPDRKMEKWNGQMNLIFSDIDVKKFPRLEDLDKAVNATQKEREAIGALLFGKKKATNRAGRSRTADVYPAGKMPSIVELIFALALRDKALMGNPHMPEEWREALKKQLPE
jgi:ppGpp synthetase/RelA/SpoT-type nucleotidyltranferase